MTYLERALGRVGIWQSACGRVASAQLVARPQPAPDVYLKDMELVGVSPERTVVVEDRPTGGCAGVAVGAVVIGYDGSCRSVELRVGQGCVSTCRSPWTADQ